MSQVNHSIGGRTFIVLGRIGFGYSRQDHETVGIHFYDPETRAEFAEKIFGGVKNYTYLDDAKEYTLGSVSQIEIIIDALKQSVS